MTDTLDLQSLRQAAQSVKHGPWEMWAANGMSANIDSIELSGAAAAYVGKLDPAFILALLDRLERAEAPVTDEQDEFAAWYDSVKNMRVDGAGIRALMNLAWNARASRSPAGAAVPEGAVTGDEVTKLAVALIREMGAREKGGEDDEVLNAEARGIGSLNADILTFIKERSAAPSAPTEQPALTVDAIRKLALDQCGTDAEGQSEEFNTGRAYGVAKMTAALMKLAAAAPVAQASQQPVVYQHRMRPMWDEDSPWGDWEDCSAAAYEDYVRVPVLHDWQHEARKLYTAAPLQQAEGAQDQFSAEGWEKHKRELRAKYPGIAGGYNILEVQIETGLDCDVTKGEFGVRISRVILGSLAADDFPKVQELIDDEIDALNLPEEGRTALVVYESGEREDVFWNKFYRIAPAQSQPAGPAKGGITNDNEGRAIAASGNQEDAK